jgi:predicted DCC family thiol-disulfide oxidoreductase YuxK
MIRALPVAFACTLAALLVRSERPFAAPEIDAAPDRIARLSATLAARPFQRDAATGFLRPLLDALNLPVESQLLVFSKTGVQHLYTSPRTPRALYFDESVVIGYVPGAPEIEIIAHDPVEGLAFYTLDQETAAPVPTRQRRCLSCHESASTFDVPGLIVRSHTVGDDGTVLSQANGATPPSHDVTQRTSHPERWGGWLVTSEGVAAPYAQRAHQGNITFTRDGNTSSQVFVDWMASAPEARGYPSSASDVVSLLAFDHQMPAINLMTAVSFAWRRATAEGRASVDDHPDMRRLIEQLADYLLFAQEAALPVPLTPRAGFASALERRLPHDSKGRSLAQFDAVNRLMRYACSYMVYSDAFKALPRPVRQAVYKQLFDSLSVSRTPERQATIEILQATIPEFIPQP